MLSIRTHDGLIIDVASRSRDRRGRPRVGRDRDAGDGDRTGRRVGAGKTRLAKAIAGALGVDPAVVLSPTFVLIHEYEGDLPVYHFDAYRLGGPAPFEALGAAEYWDAGGVCLVEWADLVADLLPANAWRVAIETTGPEARRLTITLPTTAASRLDSIARGDPATQ